MTDAEKIADLERRVFAMESRAQPHMYIEPAILAAPSPNPGQNYQQTLPSGLPCARCGLAQSNTIHS